MSKLVTEEIRVQKSESFHWAINYDLFEFLQKYIHKLDAAYRFLNGNLPPWKQESLDYFYRAIQEHRSEIFENLKKKLRAKRVYENVSFRRYTNPKDSIGLGLVNLREFSDMNSFVDWLVKILPIILDEPIPDDILSVNYWDRKKGEPGGGWIPSGLYDELINWLMISEQSGPFKIGGVEISNWKCSPPELFYSGIAWPYWLGQKLIERGYEST